MRKITPGYEKEYVEKAEMLDIMYFTPFEELRGYMNGKSPKQVIEFFERIEKCTCGGEPTVKQIEGMGDLDTIIACKKCGRSVRQSCYDRESSDDPNCEELALEKWNAGMTQEEINLIREEKLEKRRLHEEDLVWYPLYPNNMSCNEVDGIYCLLFMRSEKSIYCCKWTIKYQLQEKEPMVIGSDSPIEAYILHMKRYFDVKGPFNYPEPRKLEDWSITDVEKEDERTLSSEDVNDYGDFVRAYKTLEEAKAGALARCGWQGLSRETIIRESEPKEDVITSKGQKQRKQGNN